MFWIGVASLVIGTFSVISSGGENLHGDRYYTFAGGCAFLVCGIALFMISVL